MAVRSVSLWIALAITVGKSETTLPPLTAPAYLFVRSGAEPPLADEAYEAILAGKAPLIQDFVRVSEGNIHVYFSESLPVLRRITRRVRIVGFVTNLLQSGREFGYVREIGPDAAEVFREFLEASTPEIDWPNADLGNRRIYVRTMVTYEIRHGEKIYSATRVIPSREEAAREAELNHLNASRDERRERTEARNAAATAEAIPVISDPARREREILASRQRYRASYGGQPYVVTSMGWPPARPLPGERIERLLSAETEKRKERLTEILADLAQRMIPAALRPPPGPVPESLRDFLSLNLAGHPTAPIPYSTARQMVTQAQLRSVTPDFTVLFVVGESVRIGLSLYP